MWYTICSLPSLDPIYKAIIMNSEWLLCKLARHPRRRPRDAQDTKCVGWDERREETRWDEMREKKRRAEKRREEKKREEMRWDEMRRREEMRWDETRWDEMKREEKRREEMRWEIRWRWEEMSRKAIKERESRHFSCWNRGGHIVMLEPESPHRKLRNKA